MSHSTHLGIRFLADQGRAAASTPQAAGFGSGRKLRPQKGQGKARVGPIGAPGTHGGRRAFAQRRSRALSVNGKLAIAIAQELLLAGKVCLPVAKPALASVKAARDWLLGLKGAHALVGIELLAPDELIERACANLKGVELIAPGLAGLPLLIKAGARFTLV